MADSTILFFRSCGFSGILLLTLNFAFMPSALSTASAVVVPPGMLSPITIRSDILASCLPSVILWSKAVLTLDSSIAFSFNMLLPAAIPRDTYGIEGLILAPASTTKRGISAALSAALVIRAGVGLPSGVAGTASMHLHLP